VAKRKILVIEDDLFWHRLLARVLEGYDAYFASTCADGVRLADRHRPDCILLDFHLGDGDAVSVCEQLKKIPHLEKTPVVVVSSDPTAEFIAYSKCRASYFLLKGSRVISDLPGIVAEVLPENA